MSKLTSMQEVRTAIDKIDRDMVALLAVRQQLVERAGELKRGQDAAAVRAPARVESVINSRRLAAEDAGIDPDVAERIWRSMIAAFVDLELKVHSGTEAQKP